MSWTRHRWRRWWRRGPLPRPLLDVSTKELDRLKTLAQNQNASARALEAAEAAMKRDQVCARLRAGPTASGLGQGRGFATGPACLVHSLANQEAALIRVDLPLGEALKDPPILARVASLASSDSPVDAQVLGPAPAVDPQMQGQGFLLLQKIHPLPPGTAVKAWLTVPGEAEVRRDRSARGRAPARGGGVRLPPDRRRYVCP